MNVEECRNWCKINKNHSRLRTFIKNKYPQTYQKKIVDKIVDNVDNYMPNRDSPTFTMSPAPIVINKSPLVHFSNIKFSI